MVWFAHILVLSIQCVAGHCMEQAGGLVITPNGGGSRDQKPSPQQDIIAADEEFARRLQSQEDAKFHTGGNRCYYRSATYCIFKALWS